MRSRFLYLIVLLVAQFAFAEEDRSCCPCPNQAGACPKVEGFITVPQRTGTNPTQIIPSAQIFYRQWGVCNGSRPTLFLIPGFGFNADIWLCQQAGLCNLFCTVAVDWRGVARSSKTTGIIYTFDVYADDFHEVISQLGLTNVIMVGSSIGGTIAMDYVVRYPGEISKLALIGSFPVASGPDFCAPGCPTYPSPPVPLAALPGFIGFIASDFLGFKTFFIDNAFNEACQSQLNNLKAAFIQDGFAPQNIILTGYTPPLGWFTENITSIVSQITIPTLVAYGGIDAVVPINNSFFLRQTIPNSVLVEFFDKGHMPQATDFKRFNCVLRNFALGLLPTDCQVCPLVKPAPTPLGG
jgi:pimeloyl-ACP methyl ester carboxylesterase